MPSELQALQGKIAGDVVLPGSADYESARKPPIGRFHAVRPQAVVRCRAPEDVAETIAHARRMGLPFAIRSGGHCFAGRSSSDGIVLDLSAMSAVSVSDGVARVGAGARLGDVYDTLDRHDRTIAAGCGPTVGIAGLTLGGGLGILGRSHGLTCDQLVAAQVVLADGEIVECDEQRHEDLFWALRGAGGGHFGVVTTLDFRTLPAPPATSFQLYWPHDAAVAVIDAWQAYAPDAPDALAASLLMTASEQIDEPPTVKVFGAMLGPESARRALDELVARTGTDPSSATFEQLTYRETKRYLAGEDESPDEDTGHAFVKSEFFRRSIPTETVAALVEQLGRDRAPGQTRVLDFSPWAGAYNRVPADATAFPHRAERFLLKQDAVIDAHASPAETEAARDWLTRSWALAHRWGSGGVYPNFPDPELEDWDRAYHGDNLDRLLRIKASYDPGDTFRFHQSLPRRAA